MTCSFFFVAGDPPKCQSYLEFHGMLGVIMTCNEGQAKVQPSGGCKDEMGEKFKP